MSRSVAEIRAWRDARPGMAEHIAQLVAAMPPLTEPQRAMLRQAGRDLRDARRLAEVDGVRREGDDDAAAGT